MSLEDCGGESHIAYDTSSFINCFLEYGLSDLGFVGQPFAWQRRNSRRRLDKIVANKE